MQVLHITHELTACLSLSLSPCRNMTLLFAKRNTSSQIRHIVKELLKRVSCWRGIKSVSNLFPAPQNAAGEIANLGLLQMNNVKICIRESEMIGSHE